MARAAKKTDENNEDDKVDLFIAKFQQDYSEAIHEAREAANTTLTPAWRTLYRRNIDDHRSLVKSNVSRIENLCGMINAGDTDEDAEKDIAKAVKSLAEERVRFAAWRTRAVMAYEKTAIRCEEILHSVMRNASDSERDNPLVDHGLTAGVQVRIKGRPCWQAWQVQGVTHNLTRSVQVRRTLFCFSGGTVRKLPQVLRRMEYERCGG